MASIRKREWVTTKGEQRSAWVVAYTHKGKQHLKTFQTKREATAWRAEMHHEVKQGMDTPASTSMTVVDAGTRWLAQAEIDGLEASTVMQYRQHLNRHIVPFIGDKKLAELALANVQNFHNRFIREGRSRVMAQKATSSLGAILAHAMAEGRVARNVVHEHSRATGKRRRSVENRRKGAPGSWQGHSEQGRAQGDARRGARPLAPAHCDGSLYLAPRLGTAWIDLG